MPISHPTILAETTVEKLEYDHAGIERPMLARLSQNDDFPYGSEDTRGWEKKQALSEAQNHRCAYCGVRFGDKAFFRSSATIDHVVPKCAKGKAIWSNEVMACDLCNQGRGAMWADQYFAWVKKLGRCGAFEKGRRRQSVNDKALRPGAPIFNTAIKDALDKAQTA